MARPGAVLYNSLTRALTTMLCWPLFWQIQLGHRVAAQESPPVLILGTSLRAIGIEFDTYRASLGAGAGIGAEDR